MAWGPISVGGAANANGYTLPAATADILGGVKTGSNITNNGGTISMTKANVLAALGYTPANGASLGSAASKNVRSLSGLGASGWKDLTTDQGYVPDMAFMAYWNGAYSGGNSNLAYCNKGAFGTAATKNTGDFAAASHTHNYAGSGSAGGAANSACRLEGFATQEPSQLWGNQTGTFIHGENDSTGGSLAFRRDNPIAGELSLIIDGRFYQDEGKYMCLDTNNYSAYAATKNHTHSAATQSAAGMMSAADKKKLDNLYPVGCIYQSTSSTSPASLFGGKWEQIASERVLMGASSAHSAGTTVNAGLPNITGDSWIRPNENTMTANGCFYMIGAKNRNPSVAGYNSNVSNAPTVGLDASRSSSIYGASSTVQPAAYYVYIWRRVS